MFTFVFLLFLRGESGEKNNKFQSWIFREVGAEKRERKSKWNVEKFAVVCFLWLHTKRIATAETNERGSASELWVLFLYRTKINANAKEMENWIIKFGAFFIFR